ncbi:hypothetical protein CF319_g2645 [Tilletia indica]|nr:hypothetical protein CF319_g2645 [Tilletia indica]
MSLADISLDTITLTLPPSASSSSSSSRCTPSKPAADSDTDEDQPNTSKTRPYSRNALPSLRASLQVPPSTSASTAPPGVGGAPSARLGPSLSINSNTSFLVPPPPSSSSLLKPSPASTLRLPPAQGAGGSAVSASALKPGEARAEMPTSKKRTKVALAPGCSALDWARLKTTDDLRGGITSLMRINNLTPYMRFHPGGEDELMRVAGRDGTRLFMLTHSWVNLDSIMDGTLVGILVKE